MSISFSISTPDTKPQALYDISDALKKKFEIDIKIQNFNLYTKQGELDAKVNNEPHPDFPIEGAI